MDQKNKLYFLLLCLTIALSAKSQSDTITKLSFSNFLQLIKQNHPLLKQAELITKVADANTLMSKGGFDPKFFYDFNNKFFESKNYYELNQGGFKIPTWFGVEIKAGYEQNQGINLNPENSTPKNGLLYSQISFPILQGLIIDERRNTLKQAKIFKEISEFEKINVINDLLFKAGKTFWDWHLAYKNLEVIQKATILSEIRFNAVKRTSILGERPSVDTIEANIQLQDRLVNLNQAMLDYKTKTLLLSNFLWLNNNIPIELTDNTIPDIKNEIEDQEDQLKSYLNKVDSLINAHPSIKPYELKLQQLNIEKKFKQDKFKPILNVNYNPLFNAENLFSRNQYNYKWGFSVGFPLFLRKERGDLQLTKIKIQNAIYENANKRNEILNKIKSSVNEFKSYKNQIEIFSKNVLNYEILWQSEKRLFENGESSLFMINNREMSYINAQLKNNELSNKFKKALLETEFNIGLLNILY